VFGIGGRPGDLLAVKTGGQGDVHGSHLQWKDNRGRRDLSSPIVVGNYLLTVDMEGIAICYDAPTGSKVWTARLGGKITASPVAANGLVYFVTRDGQTLVVSPGRNLQIVSRNALPAEPPEDFLASPAFSAGQIFLRSDRALYAVGKHTDPVKTAGN
jgi:outer membrane protein assembly factor BamB